MQTQLYVTQLSEPEKLPDLSRTCPGRRLRVCGVVVLNKYLQPTVFAAVRKRDFLSILRTSPNNGCADIKITLPIKTIRMSMKWWMFLITLSRCSQRF